MSIIALLRGEPPEITDQDVKCAGRIVTLIKENLGAVPTEEEAIRDVLNDYSFEQAIAFEVADSRELAKLERVGESLIRWLVAVTACAILAMVGAAVGVQIASH